MKAIMVMFDSLNRHMLPPYGCEWVKAPNFSRLAARSVTFDQAYVGSMPCIPARRELHTGRYNFLHRSWGPIEPFDDSMPELLKKNGVYTHLVTDHQHYFEDGGCTYHHRYNSWEFARGQEGDCWKGEVRDPDIPENIRKRKAATWRQDWVNRQYIQTEADMPQAKTFENGLNFIRTNATEDNWFLQIETFDPHEPFFTQDKFKQLYPHDYDGPHYDWPDYAAVTETPDQVAHVRYEYAALVSMCDHYLGRVLDMMDELNLWEDTMLIVNTDHGYLLSEHGFWGKNYQPLYQQIANIPLFIWDPRSKIVGERRESLVQTIDLPATLLDFFGVPLPADMEGQSLEQVVRSDAPVREAALFGYHGCHVCVTDGRYVYMRGPQNPENRPLYEYTLMPTHIKSLFAVEELQDIQLVQPFDFTKGISLMKIEGLGSIGSVNPFLWGSLLFDLESDPEQEHPVQDAAIEKRMIEFMLALMRKNDAPEDQYIRIGLSKEGPVTDEHLAVGRDFSPEGIVGSQPVRWTGKGQKMYYTFLRVVPFHMEKQIELAVEQQIITRKLTEIDDQQILSIFSEVIPQPYLVFVGLHSEMIQKRG
jgi:arylsulfatase A-like enzyme